MNKIMIFFSSHTKYIMALVWFGCNWASHKNLNCCQNQTVILCFLVKRGYVCHLSEMALQPLPNCVFQ